VQLIKKGSSTEEIQEKTVGKLWLVHLQNAD